MVRTLLLLLPVLLTGCGPSADSPAASSPLEPLDWDNRTSSGCPRWDYPIEDCGAEIPMRPPFEVSEDGFGAAEIRIPLAFLDDPTVRTAAPDGPRAQTRISYAFRSLYRGTGMREWFAQRLRRGGAAPLPLAALTRTLGSPASRKGPNGLGGDTYYLGALADGRTAAIWCTATDWPNPVCRAEIETGAGDMRYLAIFPPAAADRLTRIVEIADDLFREAAGRCAAAASSAKKGPVPKGRP